MILFLAGHGHTLQADPAFAKRMQKMNANFLVSFAYPENARMQWVKKSNDKQEKKHASGKR
jgi:hypothetical protein